MDIKSIKGIANRVSHKLRDSDWMRKVGTVLMTVSVLVVLLTFYPVIKEEGKYQLSAKNNAAVLTKEKAKEKSIPSADVFLPVDEDFGIVIPKISANARIIPNVDWQDPKEYQRALTQGVAQASGTSFPDEPGNMFVFAHSGVDFYEALLYNAVFYLVDKLVPGDEVYVFYRQKKYTYKVTDKKMVAPTDTKYLDGEKNKKMLTLMTCWPPGTTFKRLLVTADQVESE